MANQTVSYTLTKTEWTQISEENEQLILTAPDSPDSYSILYKYSEVTPTEIQPCHKYIKTEDSDCLIMGSSETSYAWARLAANVDKDSIDISVTVMGSTST